MRDKEWRDYVEIQQIYTQRLSITDEFRSKNKRLAF